MSTDTHAPKRGTQAARTKNVPYVLFADRVERMIGGRGGTGGTFGRVVVEGRRVRSPRAR